MPLPRVCLVDGCPNVAKSGTNRCPDHPPKRSPSSAATGRPDWKRVRVQALERDEHKCQLCRDPATQVDHIVSVAHGGQNKLENARSVCAGCNLAARPGYTPRRPETVAVVSAEVRRGGMTGGVLSRPDDDAVARWDPVEIVRWSTVDLADGVEEDPCRSTTS